jgi:hypothetical protein
MEAMLDAWDSFYVIVGSSAGALTGLQFVVMALIAETPQRPTNTTVDTFSTPTIVHFGVVLLVAAILTAPWTSWGGVVTTLSLLAVFGIFYSIVVFLRSRRVTEYKPVLEDWLFHVAFPLLAYALLLIAALALPSFPTTALFGIGAVTLLLLFIGIHNAWDSVRFIVVERIHPANEAEPTDSA